MKRIVLGMILTVGLLMSTMILAQETNKRDDMKQDNPQAEKMSTKAVSVSGKISTDGKTFVSDDGKTWTIGNADAVKGHEGHQVTLKAHEDAAKNELQVVSLKMGKGEKKDTTKKDEMQKY